MPPVQARSSSHTGQARTVRAWPGTAPRWLPAWIWYRQAERGDSNPAQRAVHDAASHADRTASRGVTQIPPLNCGYSCQADSCRADRI